MVRLKRLVSAVFLLLLSPLLVLIPLLSLFAADLAWWIAGRRRPCADSRLPDSAGASVVIPNWNGRDLLEKYLPSVVAAMSGNPRNEIIVVDNASSDGSRELLGDRFPDVRVLPLDRNEGFGGGSNAGFRAARNDVVVLLNSDMRVEPGFLAPLLEGFSDEQVFAVGCQIFFSDPNKRREETGLTQFWWERGRLRVRHREDNGIERAYPCAYGGGGSCAYDKAKFLELGGFDEVLAPFYLEDTDLGYLAWKRGWKVLYEPRSVVFHEHRGTIGRKFTQAYIESILKKNFFLFAWKNVHDWRRLAGVFAFGWGDSLVSLLFGDSPERANFFGLLRAFLQLPSALRARWNARRLAVVDDTEALLRPLGGYFRDRFERLEPNPDKLAVLFVSPYAICPPVHGGGVFMYQTSRQLASLCDLNLVVLLDRERERDAHLDLAARCRSAEFITRRTGVPQELATALPHAIVEFRDSDLDWLIHRQIFTRKIDVVQLEYLAMAQYAGAFQRIACVLFEHDVYFQSIARQLPGMAGQRRIKAAIEYLRALRYEIDAVRRMDLVQVPSAANARYLASFVPEVAAKLDDSTRACIDTREYSFRPEGREPHTMLFVGSFRHAPNHEAISWFISRVLPSIRAHVPDARLVLVGADSPPQHLIAADPGAVELRGFVEDIREPLGRYAVFVCPILSGSGMRVKLLEAFAAGIPVVSTRLGAEGLADADGSVCSLADTAEDFAQSVVELFEDREKAARMTRAAREMVTRERDARVLTERLAREYRELVALKRAVPAPERQSREQQQEERGAPVDRPVS
jgi:O-antigen biosynthesis protein